MAKKSNIENLGDDLWNAGRNAYLAGLGVVSTTEQNARELFDKMVSEGQKFETAEEGFVQKATNTAKELGQQVEDRVQQAVSATLHRAGVPSRDEIRTLTQRVETLTRKVEQLGASN